MPKSKGVLLIEYLKAQRTLLKSHNYNNELDYNDEMPRIMDDEEYFESLNGNDSLGKELLKLLKRKL